MQRIKRLSDAVTHLKCERDALENLPPRARSEAIEVCNRWIDDQIEKVENAFSATTARVVAGQPVDLSFGAVVKVVVAGQPVEINLSADAVGLFVYALGAQRMRTLLHRYLDETPAGPIFARRKARIAEIDNAVVPLEAELRDAREKHTARN